MIEIVFSTLQAIGVVASVLFAAWQLIRNRRVLEHDSYERLSREYQSLLWQVMTFRHLDNVWEPLSTEDKKRLDKAMTENALWDVWYSMSPEEPDCYRFTRAALEIFERAWQLRHAGHIGEDTWQKWSAWIRTWSKSSYFHYVFAECSPQLVVGYAEWIRANVMADADDSVNRNRECGGV